MKIFPFSFTGKSRQSAPDAEDWQAGDIAECISGTFWCRGGNPRFPENGPTKGQRFRVLDVFTGIGRFPNHVFLELSGFSSGYYDARSFRKVRPQSDEATPAEAAFTELVRNPPRKTPAPVRENEAA